MKRETEKGITSLVEVIVWSQGKKHIERFLNLKMNRVIKLKIS